MQEGIASLAWSELPSEADLRGEDWTLVMERGVQKKERERVSLQIQPGAAYLLVGSAQGVTRACERRCTGHNMCNCCWTHGIRLDQTAAAARQSLTLRVLADDDDDDAAGPRGSDARGGSAHGSDE